MAEVEAVAGAGSVSDAGASVMLERVSVACASDCLNYASEYV